MTSRCQSRSPLSSAARTRIASKLMALTQTLPPITTPIAHSPR